MIVAIGICLFASACSDERPYGPVVDEKNALEIIASINEEQQTKADEEIKDDVDIDTGDKGEVIYYFSYVEKSSKNNLYTTIDVTGTENKVSDKDWEGLPYKTSNSQDQLTWGDINLKSRYFILDNIQYNVRKEPTPLQTISFLTEKDDSGLYSKYDAAPAPEKVGTGNDILWGQLEVSKQQGEILNPLHFELEHKMSKVTFVIFSKDVKVQSSLKESGAKVTLSNVILESASFNRLKGEVIAGTSKSDRQLDGEFENGSYITKAWIFPPQFFGDEDRPKLSVQVGGVTYTGPLNASMQIGSTTVLLEFLAGYHLIIEAELGDFNDRNIYFEPVLVEKWNVLPDKDLSVGQVGIRTTEELKECMDAFSKISSSSSSDENIRILRKYGVQNGDSWTFYLWKNLTNVCEEAFGKFLISSSHTFQWNGHTINGKGESNFKKDTE